ncbi:GNAT family N-acetyltransferase [Haloplasma contractile]|uniref:SSU ribosomal protein S18P-alanine acetyltransferase n=1 Tax=Haloplasma contractile SSD-17B TaxID=1033810 RepID=U2DY85_9MOLU|nr:N-acetyltransferase [Haloplasma contractile]ERJ13222.1 SSU ribosomal protein S18P-alanine acetyltransferase [Haloplasma contractile SSD-17B]
MIFRKASTKDLPSLAELRWDFHFEDHQPEPKVSKEVFINEFTEYLENSLNTGKWTVFIAEDNGFIISHIYIRKIDKVPKPGSIHREYGYVTNVYTKPAYRNQGIGNKLIQRVRNFAGSEHFEFLIVWPSNRAINFYEKAGFKIHNEIMEFRFD